MKLILKTLLLMGALSLPFASFANDNNSKSSGEKELKNPHTEKHDIPDDTSTGDYLEPQDDSGTNKGDKLDKSKERKTNKEDGGMDLKNKK